MKKASHIRRVGEAGDDDPLQGVANFFDLGIVFALGFMIALIAYIGLPELIQKEDFTLVKDPGTKQMEIIQKKGQKISRYRVSKETAGGEGELLGTAYRLANGEVIYVPQEESRE